MKKSNFIKFLLILILIVLSNLNIKNVYALEENFDDKITGILSGINEEDFDEIINYLNEVFNNKKTFKELVVDFLTGDLSIDFNFLISIFLGGVANVYNSVKEIVFYIILVGIVEAISNKIISKNNDNNEKNIIFYIFYIITISACSKILYEVFYYGINIIENLSKTSDKIFPVMFSISGLIGNFGSGICKPICVFLSFFTSKIISCYFLPLLSITASTLIIGNLSDNFRYNSLYKTLNSLFKWSLGLLTVIFTAVVSTQVIVNSQYNSASIKVLKYTTGSIVPVVGGFLSGGIDLLLSSAVLVKNSVGLLTILYVIIYAGSGAVCLIALSFIIKFALSICEGVINKKFVVMIEGLTNLFNNLASLIFVCGYVYVLTVLSLIFVSISLI